MSSRVCVYHSETVRQIIVVGDRYAARLIGQSFEQADTIRRRRGKRSLERAFEPVFSVSHAGGVFTSINVRALFGRQAEIAARIGSSRPFADGQTAWVNHIDRNSH